MWCGVVVYGHISHWSRLVPLICSNWICPLRKPSMSKWTPSPLWLRHCLWPGYACHIPHSNIACLHLSWPMRHFFTSMLHSQPGSQSAFAAIGGYCVPSFSTFGSQVHQDALSILSITMGMWAPQPHQEDFSVGHRGLAGRIDTKAQKEVRRLTASCAGSWLAHGVWEACGYVFNGLVGWRKVRRERVEVKRAAE